MSVVCHFLAMVNSVILGIMFSNTKNEKSNAAKYLLQYLGVNSIIPMIQFYLGCFFGGVAMLVIIFLQYIRITFYLCAFFFLFFVLVVNGVYYQYNVLAYKKAIELDHSEHERRIEPTKRSMGGKSKYKNEKTGSDDEV
jgi:hypothetical protein